MDDKHKKSLSREHKKYEELQKEKETSIATAIALQVQVDELQMSHVAETQALLDENAAETRILQDRLEKDAALIKSLNAKLLEINGAYQALKRTQNEEVEKQQRRVVELATANKNLRGVIETKDGVIRLLEAQTKEASAQNRIQGIHSKGTAAENPNHESGKEKGFDTEIAVLHEELESLKTLLKSREAAYEENIKKESSKVKFAEEALETALARMVSLQQTVGQMQSMIWCDGGV